MNWRSVLGLVVTWLAVGAFFVVYIGRQGGGWEQGLAFASRENVETILRQTSIVAFGAIGMTLVIVSGMIDLSAGSIVALVTIAIAWLLKMAGAEPLVAALGGIAAGTLGGAVNGQLITRLRVSPFIVTLGTLLVMRGIAKWIGQNNGIYPEATWLNDVLAKLDGSRSWMVLPPGVWLLVAVAIVAHVLLERTVFGRNVVAVGANEEAAALAGIDPDAIRRKVFILAGVALGLAGLMQFSRLRMGDPTVAQGLELDIIAAVVIGGARLAGGQGTIVGSLLGALVIATIRAGSSQAGFPNYIQEIVTGSIIVFALALDQWRQARHAAAG